MKKMKLISKISLFIAILMIFVSSCVQKSQDSNVSAGVVSDSTIQKVYDEVPAVEIVESVNEMAIDYSNPAFFGGTDFGNFMRVLYTQGLFSDMVKYTSKETVEKFGKERLEDFYKKMHFGYKMELTSQSTNNQDSTIILNYETNIVATKRVIRIITTVENDTVRLVINDIKTKNPFDAH